MKYFFKIALLFFAGTSLFSCKDDDLQELKDENPVIVDNRPKLNELLAANPNFSLLNEALEITRLADTVQNINSNLTFLAPNNDAFQKLLDSDPRWNSLSDMNPFLLQRIVSQHIIPNRISTGLLASDELIEEGVDAEQVVANALAVGVNIFFEKLGEDIVASNGTFNTTITEFDNDGINGIIHTVNDVMNVVLVPENVGEKGGEESKEGTVLLNLTEVPGLITDTASSDFELQISNPTTGYESIATVSGIGRSRVNPNQIVLTISEPIINTDNVLISYTGGGSIISIGDDELPAFTNVQVSPFFDTPVALEAGSFEDVGGGAGRANAGNNFFADLLALPDGTLLFERSTERSFTGEASLLYQGDPSTDPAPNTGGPDNLNGAGGAILWGLRFFGEEDRVNTVGDYAVTIRVFIEPGSDLKTINTGMRDAPPEKIFTWDLTDVEKGKWVTLPAQTVNIPALLPFGTPRMPPRQFNQYAIYVRGERNPGVTGKQKVFIDDLLFALIETR